MILLALCPLRASAAKVGVELGYFSLSAQSGARSGSASALGMYRVAYRAPWLERLELDLGYSLFMTRTLQGDLGFGLDLGVNWYPLTEVGPAEFAGGSSTFVFDPIWRPFFGGAFVQRQFQSVQTGYAGFSFKAGIERSVSERLSALASLRWLGLRGSQTASATEWDVLFGACVHF